MAALDAPERPARLPSIDLLRGAVMVIMVLDHARDFVHREGLTGDPSDPASTHAALYFTRFVTHFCAPGFVLLAGVSARLLLRSASHGELAGFLLRRGLFLVALEVLLLRPLIWFNFDYRFLAHLQVIWAIGWSMAALAAVLRLRPGVIGALGLVMVVGHNLVGHQAYAQAPFPSWQGLGILVHERGGLEVGGDGGPIAFVQYPWVPWIGVLWCGYWLGALFLQAPPVRRRWLAALGGAACLLFVLLRATNAYGDPGPWRAQPTALQTLFSFLRLEKYPPSLLFLLMTLGPSLLLLAALDRCQGRGPSRVLAAVGRVPLFFYVLQWPAVHLVSRLLQWLDGQPVGWEAPNPMLVTGPLPPGCGFSLPVVYLAWAICLLALVPLSGWFARFKNAHPSWGWLRYL